MCLSTKSSSSSTKESTDLLGKPECLSTESYSLLILLFSSLLYSAMACFVKLAASTGLPSSELVFLRAIFQGFLVLLAMFLYRDPNEGYLLIQRPFGNENVRSIVIARGIVGGLAFLCYFYSMTALPLGDATALLSLNPVITVLAAAVFLNEQIRISHIFAAGASLTGSILIAKPSFLFGQGDGTSSSDVSYPTMGYLTAILGTCLGAAVFILIRRAGKGGVHTLQLLFSWCVFGILYSFVLGVIGPLVLGVESHFVVPPTWESWIYVLGVCIFGSLGHLLMNFAARHAPAGLASIIRSSGIMWSYVLEILVFHQVPQMMTVGGVSLILGSLAVIGIEKHHHQSSSSSGTSSNHASGRDEENVQLQVNSKRGGYVDSYGSTITSTGKQFQPLTGDGSTPDVKR
jgi:drug/metabolite transporter (DMT)-like permease